MKFKTHKDAATFSKVTKGTTKEEQMILAGQRALEIATHQIAENRVATTLRELIRKVKTRYAPLASETELREYLIRELFDIHQHGAAKLAFPRNAHYPEKMKLDCVFRYDFLHKTRNNSKKGV